MTEWVWRGIGVHSLRNLMHGSKYEFNAACFVMIVVMLKLLIALNGILKSGKPWHGVKCT